MLRFACFSSLEELNLNSSFPNDDNRDRFVLSKGHGAPVLSRYSLNVAFFRSTASLNLANQVVFHEHPPKPGYIPGVEAATGSLGHGSMCLGMALAAKIKNKVSRYYALLSDGECNEGSIWEAAMLASSQNVSQLTAIIDYNKWQATGRSQMSWH